MSSLPLLQLAGVRKSFGGVRALTDASLSLQAGHAHALVGENGAGKSTLIKILTGVYRPDGGTCLLDGTAIEVRSPADAERLGISVIHQESVVFDDLSIAENIFASHPPRRFGFINWRQMQRQAGAVLAQLECTLDPRRRVATLSIAERHLVQIARALARRARIVIMDEPTAALSHRESEDLLRIVGRLKQEGRAVLYITHRFEEIFAIADEYTVLRDGATVGAGPMHGTSVDALIQLMAGRPVGEIFPKSASAIGEEVLRVQHLTATPEFRDVSFALRRGEILGVYGLIGAGRSELMQTLFGLQRADSGEVLLAGKAVSIRSPAQAIRSGLAYVPEDRQHQGAILSRSICDNIALPSLARLARRGFTRPAAEQGAAQSWASKLQIRCRDVAQLLQELSGGNQQKVVLARWLLTAPQVLILDEPTKGIDVGAKAAVHQLTGSLVAAGLAVILVSSELPEILAMSDRILVMRRGVVRGCFERGEASAEAILKAATDA